MNTFFTTLLYLTMEFTTWMIVYTPNAARVANYNHMNQSIRTNLFVAVDSVANFKKTSDFAIENKYSTRGYVDSIKSSPGKLGCNLSHQLLLEEIAKNSPTDWNLVLEDDTYIFTPMFLKDIDYVLQGAESCASKYIQLYTHPRFVEPQRKYNRIGDNLYNMMRQWGTCAYFIHKDAIPLIKSRYPFERNIDFIYCSLLNELRSLCWLSPCVRTLGAVDSSDNSSTLGSICDNKFVHGVDRRAFENCGEHYIYKKYIPNKTQEGAAAQKIVREVIDDMVDTMCKSDCVENIPAEFD